MKKIVLTDHARARLRGRTIKIDWVETTARTPAWSEPDPIDPEVERRFHEIPEFGNRILRVAARRLRRD